MNSERERLKSGSSGAGGGPLPAGACAHHGEGNTREDDEESMSEKGNQKCQTYVVLIGWIPRQHASLTFYVEAIFCSSVLAIKAHQTTTKSGKNFNHCIIKHRLFKNIYKSVSTLGAFF